MRAESSLSLPPTKGIETTASLGPLAPVVTGRPLSPLESAAAGARSAPSGLAGWRRGPGRGAALGAWAAGTGRARGRGVTEPPPATPARPAGADSPVSPGLSNCLAVQAPCPETAAGTGRGGVWWAGLPVRSPMELRSQALEQNSGLGRSERRPAHPPVLPPWPDDCALRPGLLSAGLSGGRWEAREAQSQGRAGRARRGSLRDRSNRRRRAWLGVLNADPASGGVVCGGETPRSAWRRGPGARVAAAW